MRIGEVADALGIPTRTIRFYERRGLLPEPDRSSNGYRVYDESTIDRLRFIKSSQAAGLTLAEICGVTDIRDSGSAPCSHVSELLEAKLEEVKRRRRELKTLQDELSDLLAKSQRLDPADCTDRAICHILSDDTPEG